MSSFALLFMLASVKFLLFYCKTCTSNRGLLKMIATSVFLAALECTKFVFGHPCGANSAPLDTQAGLRGALLLRERGGEEKGGEGTEERKGDE